MKKILFIFFILFLFFSLFSWTLSAQNPEWHRPDTRIPYRNVNGKLIVDVEIGGRVRPFIFDTGAGGTCITDSLYAELGLDSIRTVQITDSGGKSVSRPIARGDTLRMGDWTITGQPLWVLDSDNPLFECFGVEGIIGSDILQNRAVRFASRDSVILLAGDASAFGLEKRDGIKVLLRGNCPSIRMAFSNGRKRTTQLVLFDTGARDFGMNIYALRVLNRKGTVGSQEESVGRRAYGIHGAEDETPQFRGEFPRLGIGGRALERVPFSTTIGRNSLLGTFLLEYGDVTIDYGGKRFYYEPFAEKQTVGNPDERAISLMFIERELVVGIVWDEALKPLIRSGDRILSLDGRPADTYHMCDFITGGTKLEKNVKATVETESGGIIEITI